MYIVHRVHSLLQLCGFYLREIPFTRYISLVLFLHLRINKSSDYAILSKNLLFSSSKHFTSEPVSQTERRLARGEVHGSIYNTVPTENLAHFSCPSPIDIHD